MLVCAGTQRSFVQTPSWLCHDLVLRLGRCDVFHDSLMEMNPMKALTTSCLTNRDGGLARSALRPQGETT